MRPDTDPRLLAREPVRRPALEPNVAATVMPRKYLEARRLLAECGEAQATPHFNVLVLKVDDASRFLESISERLDAAPGRGCSLGRLLPAAHRFSFQSSEECEKEMFRYPSLNRDQPAPSRF